jgi:hypothetical protein
LKHEGGELTQRMKATDGAPQEMGFSREREAHFFRHVE